MIFPLGLGLKLKNAPFATLLIIVCCILVSWLGKNQQFYEKEFLSLPEQKKVVHRQNMLFYEYCKTYSDLKLCDFYALENGIAPQKGNAKSFNLPEEPQAFTSLYREFVGHLDGDQLELKALASYPDYQKSLSELQEKTNLLRKRNHLLHMENINLLSILKAIFSHDSSYHLLSNMFFLLVFGSYVEQRIGIWGFFSAYLGLGALAISAYTLSAGANFLNVIGASANVSVIVGLFTALFFRQKFKVLIFYVGFKIIRLPVRHFMFVLFILQEFIFSFSLGQVAHLSHTFGILLGLSSGAIIKKVNALPTDFIYPFERDLWNATNFSSSSLTSEDEKRINEILTYNPHNYLVLGEIIHKCLIHANNSYEELSSSEQKIVYRALPQYCGQKARHAQYDKILQALEKLPLTLNAHALKSLKQSQLITLIDHCIDQDKLEIASALIQIYTNRYPPSSANKALNRTLTSVIIHMPATPKTLRHLRALSSMTSSLDTKKILGHYIRILKRQHTKEA